MASRRHVHTHPCSENCQKTHTHTLSLLGCDFQTPENGTAEKRPVPKATPTPRAPANKNGSSATAANKTAGICAHTRTQSLYTFIILLYLQCHSALCARLCDINTIVWENVSKLLWLVHCVASATWPLQQGLNSLQLQEKWLTGTSPGNRLTELLPYVTLNRIQVLTFEDSRLVFLSAHHKQYLTSLSEGAVTQPEPW